MNIKSKTISLFLYTLLFGVRSITLGQINNDPHQWLEDVEGDAALEWVQQHNQQTLEKLKSDPLFNERKAEALKILTASDKIIYCAIRGGYAYNFWRDDKHIQGIWRRTPVKNYLEENYSWETLIDIDRLSQKEGVTWVWKGTNFLNSNSNRCLVTLSKGGKDASEVREFDVDTQTFVEGGFFLPEAKSEFTWVDQNTLLVATNWGKDSLTESGYPRTIKRLKRGEPLDQATHLFTAKRTNVWVGTISLIDGEDRYEYIIDGITTFGNEKYIVLKGDELLKLPIPKKSNISALLKGQLVVSLEENWTVGGETYTSGSMVSFNLKEFIKKKSIDKLHTIFIPTSSTAIQSSAKTKSSLLVTISNHVVSEIHNYDFKNGQWYGNKLDFPKNGVIGISYANSTSDIALITYSNFLTPTTLYLLNESTTESKPIQNLPHRFDSDKMEAHQHFATSKDGTKIPYFVISKKGIKRDGTNPTYLYGYGGFSVSRPPFYLETYGKLWVEKGGVFVLSNIRGGGEYGPNWHQAALKENRQRAYDDFHAIAEDLIAQKITSPKYLGIGGGSNGGLLVGVAFTQRPDLYNAVYCAVPLLDMMRYHLLLAGASWIGEYGDPRIPEERAFIKAYSPYQNLNKDKKYPEVFFYTSTKDDRVHPAHARKMAAKMESMQHPFYYFERIEGGHAGGSNLVQYAELYALQFTYLHKKLSEEENKDKDQS